MNILEKIVASKHLEVDRLKREQPISRFRARSRYQREGYSLKTSLQRTKRPGIIAEHKRKSPSKGLISSNDNLKHIVAGYQEAGALAISVLTDTQYFGGTSQHLEEARSHVQIPILRKEFIIDAYQIEEAKALGADLILLIAEVLSTKQVQDLSQRAHDLGLEVLLEMHSSSQVHKICDQIDLVGINNRDLTTFKVDLQKSIDLLDELPNDRPCIAESGIENEDTVHYLWDAGFRGFLIGERFMRCEDPADACSGFINSIHKAYS